MDMKKAMLVAMQEYLLPELQEIKSGQARLETELNAVNKRLDDVNLHLADQSRRIDETNKRMDRLYEVIVRRDEHSAVVIKIGELDNEIREIKQRLAA